MDFSRIIVLDTETSDLDPNKGARLLELAWLELEMMLGEWTVVNIESHFIEYTGTMSPNARAIHHIRPDQLTLAGGALPRDEVVKSLLHRGNATTVFVAHNYEFDVKFLPEIKGPWICTLKASRHLWPNAPGHSNQVLRYWLGVEPTIKLEGKYPHQAIYDVATTTGILLKMLGSQTLVKLVSLTKTPVVLKKINFGKHRGSDFANIPIDYLRWLRGQPNLDPDLRHTIDSMLK